MAQQLEFGPFSLTFTLAPPPHSLINVKAENFSEDISCKIEGDFSFLIVKGFRISFIKPALVLHVLHFIGDFFYKTRASLARAAF